MVMGAVMLGGIITGKPPVSITQVTPIARLTTEYNVFVLPASSPFKTMKDVVEALKKDPGSIKWGGGSRGSTEHIAASQIAQAVGVPAAKINYVPFRGGGEAVAAILGGNVTVGGSGYSEFQQYIESGKMKAIAVTAGQRVKGLDKIPTLKEQGIDVEIGNWRGVYGAAGITPEQRAALTDMIVKATKSKAWQDAAGQEQLDAGPADRQGLRRPSWTRTSPPCARPWSAPAWCKHPTRSCLTQRPRRSRRGRIFFWSGAAHASRHPQRAASAPRSPPGPAGHGHRRRGAGGRAGLWRREHPLGRRLCGRGPRLFALAGGRAAMGLCGVLLIWEVRTGGFRNMEEPSGAARGDWHALAWVSAGILGNAALITTIGFVLSCALCFALAVRGLRISEGKPAGNLPCRRSGTW